MEHNRFQENQLLEQAIVFATECHAGQLRKGTQLPYILHPLETMLILRTMNADKHLLMAGVLHDTIEDTDATEEQLLARFGADAAGLVCAHSEDKSKTWDERKTHAIEELAHSPTRLKMLVMADKLSNLRSIAADYQDMGDKLWGRFNAPMEKQSWYYSGIIDALDEMRCSQDTAAAYWEMNALYKEVFVTFYYHAPTPGRTDAYLIQAAAHGTAYRLDLGDAMWRQVDNTPEQFAQVCRIVPRWKAEETEDQWINLLRK